MEKSEEKEKPEEKEVLVENPIYNKKKGDKVPPKKKIFTSGDGKKYSQRAKNYSVKVAHIPTAETMRRQREMAQRAAIKKGSNAWEQSLAEGLSKLKLTELVTLATVLFLGIKLCDVMNMGLMAGIGNISKDISSGIAQTA
jgi:hypothetical protein